MENVSSIKGGFKPLSVLSISIARYCKFFLSRNMESGNHGCVASLFV